MKYDPTQAKSNFCHPPGDYEASLVSCEEKPSKTNVPMAVLNWRIFPEDGSPPFLVKDWILLEGEFNGLWKLKKIAKAWDIIAKFDDGTFDPANHIESNLIVKLKVKPADGKYSESNAIADYKPLKRAEGEASTVTAALKAQIKRAEAQQTEPTFAPDDIHNDVPF